MPVSLVKGQNVSLSKEVPGLTKITVGLGWDAKPAGGGQEFDLDACAFLLGENDKVRGDFDFIFYNQLKSSDGSVVHSGDNRTGNGAGDDESINIDLSKVPADVKKIVVCVSIDQAAERRQNFGQVRNAYVRIINQADTKEIAKYDLSEDASVEAAMKFAEIYRNASNPSEWKFKAIGEGARGGLLILAQAQGVQVG